MLRLFVALKLPVAMRDVLLGVMGGVVGARWQRDDQLHLTLRFVGEVDRHKATDIDAALDGVRFETLELTLGAPGSFERRGRIENLGVGVTPQTPVTAPAKRVNQALLRVGVSPEHRTFVAHITMARLPRNTGSITDFPLQPPPAKPFKINSSALWQSQLGRDGVEYHVAERFGAIRA